MIQICPDMASSVAQMIQANGLREMSPAVQAMLEEDVRLHRELRDLTDWFVVRANNIDELFRYLKDEWKED